MTPAEYRQLLIAARRSQLERTQTNVARLERLYVDLAKSLARRLRQTESDSLTRVVLTSLLADATEMLRTLRNETATVLQLAMLDTAQTGAERERKLAELLGKPADDRLTGSMLRRVTLSNGSEVSVQFGRIAYQTVEALAERVYRDGLNLSGRLYNLNEATRKTIEDTVVQGVAEQLSARKLAQRLEASLTQAGASNPRYQARRIARTEITNAHREAHIRSTMNPNGTLKDFIKGVRWSLSLSHRVTDICDVWASDDGDDLGNGIYLPGNVPVAHPNCLCHTSSVLVEFPEVGISGRRAVPDEVSDTQLRYYAETLQDPTALRLLERRGG